MQTVVFGWFGASAVWFLPLLWRLVKSALPGGAGLRGPGTIRLWLGFVCVLIASDKEVSLKKLASAAGTKDAAMLPSAEAERITGYHVGGISPLGQRKRVRVFIEAAAMENPTIIFNGGRRGLQIEIPPQELVRLLDAKPAELS